MKHPVPDFVKEYYAKVDALSDINEPECCHTCDHYNEEGTCLKYLIEPPEDFAQKLNQCEEWLPIIPF